MEGLKAQIPMKIAVAGGGVGGVFLGYALQRRGFDVTVFEKASKFSRFGGPIQLASNALSCVNDLDPQLFEKIMGRFTFTGTRKCGIKDGIRNSWYSVFEAIKNLAEWNTLPYTGVIDRPDLQEVLLGSMAEGTVKNSMAITSYEEQADGTVDITINGGEQVIKGFDVLVGADGIWSNVRAQMWGEPSSRPGTCTYSGYTLFAAETVMKPDSEFFNKEGYFDAGYKVYIGPSKYFVTSDVGSGRIQWYAFLALPAGTKARASNAEFCKEEFEGWSPEIHACLNNTPDEIIEQRDLYDRRPSVLKSWSKGHVTMLGDAVHPVRVVADPSSFLLPPSSFFPLPSSLCLLLLEKANLSPSPLETTRPKQMMPNLGQGGCQAIEDAYVLTNLLCDVTDKSQLPDRLQEYYRQRIVRSAIVQGMSRLSSDIIITSFSTPFRFDEFVKEGLDYKYLTLPSLLTSYLQFFLPYIFYAQFGYLYSFAPSAFTADKIKELVGSSVARNKDEVKRVYATLRDNAVTYFSAKTMSFMQYDEKTKEFKKLGDAQDFRAKV